MAPPLKLSLSAVLLAAACSGADEPVETGSDSPVVVDGAPAVAVQPLELQLSALNGVGDRSAQPIRISSQGDGVLTVQALQVIGDDEQLIALSDAPGWQLQPGQSAEVWVSCLANDHQESQGKLQVHSDDPETPLIEVLVRCGEACTEQSADWQVAWLDEDGDGYGDAALSVEGCGLPEGYAAVAGDCDDTDSGLHPGAQELCDLLDQDCDAQVDEGLDRDGDGVLRCCEGGPYMLYQDRDRTRVWAGDADEQGAFRVTGPVLETSGAGVGILQSPMLQHSDGGDMPSFIWRDHDTDGLHLAVCDHEWFSSPLDLSLAPRAVGDVDGDGCVDLVGWLAECCPLGGTLEGYTALGDCQGGFSEQFGTFDISALDQVWSAGMGTNMGDLNSDGHADVVLHSYTDGGDSTTSVWGLFGQGDGSFDGPVLLTQAISQPQNIGDVGDIDGDGCLDWVGGPDDDGDKGAVMWAAGDCAGGLGAPVELVDICDSCPGGGGAQGSGSSKLHDVDDDGDLDLMVGHSVNTGVSATVTVFHNDGAGVFGGPSVLLDEVSYTHWFLLPTRGR